MFKHRIVLAMALGALAAMALSGAAGANWKHNGQAIQQDVQLPFTGTQITLISNLFGSGSLGCQITSDLQLKASQTTGTLTSFKAHPTSDTANCFGTGGLAFCQVHNLQPQQGFQWVVHTAGGTQTSITITHGAITNTMTGGFCPFHHLNLTAGTLEGHVDAHKFSTMQLTGKSHLILQPASTSGAPLTGTATVSGLLHLEQTPTYEI